MFTIQLPALDRLDEQLTQSSSQILRRISDSSTSTSEAVAAALSNVQPATVDLAPLREDVRTLLKAHDERFNSLKSAFDAQASLIRALAGDVWSLKNAAAATTSFTTADRDLLKARGDTITSLYSSFTALNCMLTRFLSGPGTDQVVEESTVDDDACISGGRQDDVYNGDTRHLSCSSSVAPPSPEHSMEDAHPEGEEQGQPEHQSSEAVDLVSAVTEWHALSSQDLSMLIRNAENGTILWTKSNGTSFSINVESIARYLALHLITKLLSPKIDEQHLRYLLGGLRLLHTLCDIAPRHARLEQVLLDDVTVSEQILDVVFYTVILLSGLREKVLASGPMALLHSASLASSLHLLLASISSKWHELTHVLLAHPKVDAFTSVAFPALSTSAYFLQVKLSDRHANVDEVRQLSHHCEASLQFLLSLCQQKLFRERLIMNKDLCEEGGALLLVQDIMKLPQSDDSRIMATVSRIKSKALSMMLHLCETDVERGSFLDLAATTTEGLDLAKSVAFQVLEVLRIMFSGDRSGPFKGHPRGLLQLNAMRLTEIFSDDSNFRSYIVLNFTEVLTTVFLLPHEDFLSSWCSSANEPCEEDVVMEYDSLAASGQALGVLSTSHVVQFATRNRRAPQTTPYAQQKTSLLVKIIANLTCFLPDICKEEEGLFANKFLQSLQKELPRLSERTDAACRNLQSLLHHAESLREYLNEDDVQLLRLFIRQLEARITPQDSNIHRLKEIQNNRGQSSSHAPPQRSSPEAIDNRNASVDQLHRLNLNDENRSNDAGREEDQRTGVPETSAPPQGVHENDRNPQNIETNVEGIPEDQIVRNVQSEERQQKKRKRNIMNDEQITMIENALRDEPDMQRKAATVQFWADKLSLHGSEVTSTQLKNWINNRKAKLARAAAKDVPIPSTGDDALTDRQGGGSGTDPVSDTPESPTDEFFDPSPSAPPQGTHQNDNEISEAIPSTSSFRREHGQQVVLTNDQREEVGKGRIHLANGIWFGRNLEESGLCVVDVNDLKVDLSTDLPHPCDATGTTFGQAEQILGRKRVLWDSSRLLLITQRDAS